MADGTRANGRHEGPGASPGPPSAYGSSVRNGAAVRQVTRHGDAETGQYGDDADDPGGPGRTAVRGVGDHPGGHEQEHSPQDEQPLRGDLGRQRKGVEAPAG